MKHDRHLIVLAGATAVGKTAISIDLAKELQTEILSCDSRQFFREMRIGTARPTLDEMQGVEHHFIGHKSISEKYDAIQFANDALAKLEQLFDTHRAVIMTGGSGLYIDALCNGMDELPDVSPEIREEVRMKYKTEGLEYLQNTLKSLDKEYFERVDKNNPQRLIRAIEVSLQAGKPYSSFLTNTAQERDFEIHKFCIDRPREELYERINQRVERMMEDGLLEEVKSLKEYRHLNALNTVGYKELFAFLDGETTLAEAVELIKRNTRRYAKRQYTWWRRDAQYEFVPAEKWQDILLRLKTKGL